MSKRTTRFCALSLLLVTACHVPTTYTLTVRAQGGRIELPDYSSAIAKIQTQVPEQLERMHVPGLAIALVDGDKVMWAGGFGHTDWSKKVRVTPDTLFSVQSVSKTFAATGVLIAVGKGLIKLDAPVKDYVPGFSVKSRLGPGEAGRITTRHLLSHRSGLCHEAPVGNNYDDSPSTFEEHVKSFSKTWLKFKVGDRYGYSNLGIDLAGYVLQLRAKKPFEDFIKDELFVPLGMASSTFRQPAALSDQHRAKGNTEDRTFPDIPIPIIPSGGMYSTVNDMAKFVSFNLAGGDSRSRRILSGELLREMRKPQFSLPGQVGGYGLGIDTAPWHGGTLLYHRGNGYGYSADMRWSPEFGVGVVVLSNAEQGIPLTDGLANQALTLMVETKYGSIPPDKELKFPNRHSVGVDEGALRRLEGTYGARGSVVTLKVMDGSLYLALGANNVQFTAHSPTQFTISGHMVEFDMGASGRVKGLLHFSTSGVEYMPLNDGPNEPAGPNRREWQKFVGKYEGRYTRIIPQTALVSVRNGYLYLKWQGDWKLTEYKPNLFFTADGEAVVFHAGRMLIGNRPFLRE